MSLKPCYWGEMDRIVEHEPKVNLFHVFLILKLYRYFAIRYFISVIWGNLTCSVHPFISRTGPDGNKNKLSDLRNRSSDPAVGGPEPLLVQNTFRSVFPSLQRHACFEMCAETGGRWGATFGAGSRIDGRREGRGNEKIKKEQGRPKPESVCHRSVTMTTTSARSPPASRWHTCGHRNT